MNLPGISCYCATYGRPKKVIENCIECFLQQDWIGPKELVIFNDCKYQKFIFNHPEVKIINDDEHIAILGKKFNETVNLCKYDYIATWEDDDVFLKNRLSYSFGVLKDKKAFHTNYGFAEKSKFKIKKSFGHYHSTHLLEKNLFYDIGMYDEQDVRGIDIQFIKKIGNAIGIYSQYVAQKDLFYIYRWSTTGSYHASGSNYTQGIISIQTENRIKKLIDSGKLEHGEIELEPKLDYNYYEYLPL